MVVTAGRKNKTCLSSEPGDKEKSTPRHWGTLHSRVGPPVLRALATLSTPGSPSPLAPPRQIPPFVSLHSAHFTRAGSSAAPTGPQALPQQGSIPSCLYLSPPVFLAWTPVLIYPANSYSSFKIQASFALLCYLCILSLLSNINDSIRWFY